MKKGRVKKVANKKNNKVPKSGNTVDILKWASILIAIIVLSASTIKSNFLSNSTEKSSPSPTPTIAPTPTPRPQSAPKSPEYITIVLPHNGESIRCVSTYAQEVKEASNLFKSQSVETSNKSTKCVDNCIQSSNTYRSNCLDTFSSSDAKTECYKGATEIYKSCGQRCLETGKKEISSNYDPSNPYVNSLVNLVNKYCLPL